MQTLAWRKTLRMNVQMLVARVSRQVYLSVPGRPLAREGWLIAGLSQLFPGSYSRVLNGMLELQSTPCTPAPNAVINRV